MNEQILGRKGWRKKRELVEREGQRQGGQRIKREREGMEQKWRREGDQEKERREWLGSVEGIRGVAEQVGSTQEVRGPGHTGDKPFTSGYPIESHLDCQSGKDLRSPCPVPFILGPGAAEAH